MNGNAVGVSGHEWSDSILHRPLLQKFRDFNVQSHILKSLNLCARNQYVCVNGSSSDILPAYSGVLQDPVFLVHQ